MHLKGNIFVYSLETLRQNPLTLFPPSCNNDEKVNIKLDSLYTITALKFVGCYLLSSNRKFGMKVKKIYSEEEVYVYNGVNPSDILVFMLYLELVDVIGLFRVQ